MIIFLDFDGVLHPLMAKPDEHFCCLPRLAGVLHDYPDVQIVITSTWRLTRSLDALQELFPDDLRQRVIGVTPVGEFNDRPGAREWEALTWLERHNPGANWIALDDYAPAWFSLWRVVLCQNGFQQEEEIELRAHFTETCQIGVRPASGL